MKVSPRAESRTSTWIIFSTARAKTRPFTKLATQSFNATTLPGQFDLNLGHQVFVGQGIPVKDAFKPGRLSARDQGNRQDQRSDGYAERSVHRVVSGAGLEAGVGRGIMIRWIPAAAIATFVLGAPSCVRAGPRQANAAPTAARFPAGSIEGRVLDDGNTPSSGAMVSVVGRTTAAATTDRDGRYTLRELPYGPYILSVHSRGYFKSRGRTVQLTTSKVSIPEIQLQLAQRQESAGVERGAGGRRDQPRRRRSSRDSAWTHRSRAARQPRGRRSERAMTSGREGKPRGACGICRAAS